MKYLSIVNILFLFLNISCNSVSEEKDIINNAEQKNIQHFPSFWSDSNDELSYDEITKHNGNFQMLVHDNRRNNIQFRNIKNTEPDKSEAKPSEIHGDTKEINGPQAERANIDQIVVNILEIRVVTESDEVITVSSDPMEFDLLEFTPDRPIELINTFVPDGRYCQIRFLFPENMTIFVEGEQKNLKTPSATTSGYKLNYDGCFELKSGQFFSMTLDFDSNESVVYNPGPDEYLLKPVLKIVHVDTAFLNTYTMETSYNDESYVVRLTTMA